MAVLIAVLWQSEANAQTVAAAGGRDGSGHVAGRRSARRGYVSKRKHRRVGERARLSRMRERARLYEPFIAETARKYRVDPRALWTIAYLETRFRPNQVSPVGARGLMQFMPATARRLKLADPHDSERAIDAAGRYVAELTDKFGGRLDLVLASYNAGEGAVDCYLTGRSSRSERGKLINPRRLKTGGVPPYAETVSYVRRGLLVFARLSSAEVFSSDLVARSRALVSPQVVVSARDRMLVDAELAELGGSPAASLLFSSRMNASVAATRVSLGGGSEKGPANYETVFFDVHSGERYLVSEGRIVKPLESVSEKAVEAEGGSLVAGSEGSPRHTVSKSYYMGSGGE